MWRVGCMGPNPRTCETGRETHAWGWCTRPCKPRAPALDLSSDHSKRRTGSAISSQAQPGQPSPAIAPSLTIRWSCCALRTARRGWRTPSAELRDHSQARRGLLAVWGRRSSGPMPAQSGPGGPWTRCRGARGTARPSGPQRRAARCSCRVLVPPALHPSCPTARPARPHCRAPGARLHLYQGAKGVYGHPPAWQWRPQEQQRWAGATPGAHVRGRHAARPCGFGLMPQLVPG